MASLILPRSLEIFGLGIRHLQERAATYERVIHFGTNIRPHRIRGKMGGYVVEAVSACIVGRWYHQLKILEKFWELSLEVGLGGPILSIPWWLDVANLNK